MLQNNDTKTFPSVRIHFFELAERKWSKVLGLMGLSSSPSSLLFLRGRECDSGEGNLIVESFRGLQIQNANPKRPSSSILA